MSADDEKPPARPGFRKLAIGLAVICFLLAVVFGFAPIEGKLLGVVICLFVGFIMATIGATGYWPPPRKR